MTLRPQELTAGATRRHGVAAVFLGSSVLFLLLFAAIARGHGVNADEGFYVLAGLRVLAGERLYADFFYPQMPYLPLALAAVFAGFEPPLVAARMLSAVPGALAGGLLVALAWVRTGCPRVALVVAVLYGAYVLNVHYLTVTKTYGLTNLLLLAAFALVATLPARRWVPFAVGLLCALAVGARLPAVPVAAVLGLWLARGGAVPLAGFVAGGVLGALPCAWIFFSDPAAFWFNNLGFHELRKELSGLLPILQQKLAVLARWMFMPQNTILWILAAVGCWRAPREAALPLACAAGLAAIYLYATPTYLEYMVQIAPFLLILALPALALLVRRRFALAVVVLLYLAGLGFALRPTDPDTPRGHKLAMWNLSTVQSVANHLREASAPGDRILSWWEGYPWLAERDGYRGVGFWESNVAKKLAVAERERYHVRGNEEVAALIGDRDPRLVVFADDVWVELLPALGEGYAPRARFGAVHVYERRPLLAGDEP